MKYIALIFLMNVIYGQDELDLDVMWENTIWEEIEEITTKEFEVEKVTGVAGVRGAEAEDEILSYLYYRLNSKTNQMPPKLLQLLLSDTNTH